MGVQQEWIVIAAVIVTVGLLLSEQIRADLVGLLVLALLPLTGVISFQESLSGFSRSVVITILCLFIITEALEDTGVVQAIANRIRNVGAGSEPRLILLFMGVGALLSLIMNNVAAGAVLMPAAVQVGRESNVAPSKLLIPVAFGTLVGGMATYFTTANIVLSSALQDAGQGTLNMLDFILTGGLIVLLTMLFMAFWGRKLLPNHETAAREASANMLSRSLSETYKLHEQLWEVMVTAGSQLAGKTLGELSFGAALGINVAAIWRGHQAIVSPSPNEMIQENDFLLVIGDEERIGRLREIGAEIGRSDGHFASGEEYVVDLTEIVIPPRSQAVGKSLMELRFRNKYELTGVALWRRGHSYYTNAGKMALEEGDALLMVGSPPKIKELQRDPDFLVLQSSHAARPPLPHKAVVASTITAIVLLCSIVNLFPTSEAMLMGVAALALTGCIHLDEAYRAISWRVVFLIVGMLPLSLAVSKVGLAEQLGSGMVALLHPYGALTMIAGLFLVAMIVTQIVGGQVAGVLLAPIAISSALNSGINPKAIAVAIAIACSTAFLTPLAHPVNVLMMGPGGYTTKDFYRVGIWMTIITFVGLLLGMKLFWRV